MDRSLRMTQATESGCENNKKLREVYKSSDIIRVIKTGMRCVGHVAGKGGRGHQMFIKIWEQTWTEMGENVKIVPVTQ